MGKTRQGSHMAQDLPNPSTIVNGECVHIIKFTHGCPELIYDEDSKCTGVLIVTTGPNVPLEVKTYSRKIVSKEVNEITPS